jgi:hypothetical protein
LAPVGTVYVTCTESYDNGGGGGGMKTNKTEKTSAAEVTALLSRLVNVIESRDDVAPHRNNNNNDDSGGISVHVLPTLSKSKATTIAETTLRRLLGGENDTRYLSYRGDKRIAEESMVLWTLGCFFSADVSYSNNTTGNVK